MPADITQVIRTGATHGHTLRIFVIGYINLVIGGIVVVLNAENNRTKKVVMFNQVNKSDGMDLLSPPDHFITAVCVNVF